MSKAFNILEKIFYSNRYNFMNLELMLTHFYDTGEIAGEIADDLGLNVEEAVLAGYFHDIGRCFTKDKINHAFHEIIGARYFEEKGFGLGIADSQEQCDRISQSFRSHFIVYEQFIMPEYKQWLPGLKDANPDLLLPKSWNELVIIYADLTNINGKRISFEDRIADIKERAKKNDNPRLKALEEAEPRLLTLKKKVEEALYSKKLDLSEYIVL